MRERRVRLKKEVYELARAEAERRGATISELVNEAVFWFLHGHHPIVNSYTINNFDRALSEIEGLRREIEKVKQFLIKKFGMEAISLK